jgi:hypothetical protein
MRSLLDKRKLEKSNQEINEEDLSNKKRMPQKSVSSENIEMEAFRCEPDKLKKILTRSRTIRFPSSSKKDNDDSVLSKS